jgi:hypothetical protein
MLSAPSRAKMPDAKPATRSRGMNDLQYRLRTQPEGTTIASFIAFTRAPRRFRYHDTVSAALNMIAV